MNIELGKKYQTRDGRVVRILCVDGPGKYPVFGIVGVEESTSTWNISGMVAPPAHEGRDLIPVTTKHEAEMLWEPHSHIPVVRLDNGNTVNLTCFLDLLTNGTALKAHVTWES